MAMMKENGFMPSAGASEKDSCFFVKLRRISVRPEKKRRYENSLASQCRDSNSHICLVLSVRP